MNRQEQDILNILAGGTFSGQRELAEESGYSLGVVYGAPYSFRYRAI